MKKKNKSSYIAYIHPHALRMTFLMRKQNTWRRSVLLVKVQGTAAREDGFRKHTLTCALPSRPHKQSRLQGDCVVADVFSQNNNAFNF